MRRILFVGNAGYIHTQRFAAHYRDRGVDVHVASFQPGEIPGVTVHRLPDFGAGKAGFVLAVPRLRRLGRMLRPDVTNAHYATSYGFVAAAAGLHPLVITAWGTDVLLSPKESRVLRTLVRFALRRADAVTTVAEHMNAHVAALGVPAGRIVAVPFGVDTELFRLGQERIPGRGPLRIICTRNFDTLYDIPTLIRAVAALAADSTPLHVDLVGRGPLRQQLERQVEQAGLRDQVTFHGHLGHQALVGLLQQSDIFVSPAISDGNNVSLNEGMACGCFPVATRIAANEQWLEDGVTGFLFPPGDDAALAQSLRRAIADPRLRSAARTVNRRVIEQRASWQACLERYDGIFADAIRRHGAPA